jgi:hypothetical protein
MAGSGYTTGPGTFGRQKHLIAHSKHSRTLLCYRIHTGSATRETSTMFVRDEETIDRRLPIEWTRRAVAAWIAGIRLLQMGGQDGTCCQRPLETVPESDET